MHSSTTLAGIALFTALLLALPAPRAPAADAPTGADAESAAMTNARLDALIRRVDGEAEGGEGQWRFTVAGEQVMVITDASADRMRIIAPVARADGLEPARLYRLLQANFDSALDARYCIARELLWSAFIHPLGPLDDAQFLTAIGQVVNLVITYGDSYSSGALMFRGGDSEDLRRRQLIEELLRRGLAT